MVYSGFTVYAAISPLASAKRMELEWGRWQELEISTSVPVKRVMLVLT